MGQAASNAVLGQGKYTGTGFEPVAVAKPIGRDSYITEFGSEAKPGLRASDS